MEEKEQVLKTDEEIKTDVQEILNIFDGKPHDYAHRVIDSVRVELYANSVIKIKSGDSLKSLS